MKDCRPAAGSEAEFARLPGGTLGGDGIRLQARPAVAIEISQLARGQWMTSIGCQAPPTRGLGGIRRLPGITGKAQYAQLVSLFAITPLRGQA